jgi:hypothetical protein
MTAPDGSVTAPPIEPEFDWEWSIGPIVGMNKTSRQERMRREDVRMENPPVIR